MQPVTRSGTTGPRRMQQRAETALEHSTALVSQLILAPAAGGSGVGGCSSWSWRTCCRLLNGRAKTPVYGTISQALKVVRKPMLVQIHCAKYTTHIAYPRSPGICRPCRSILDEFANGADSSWIPLVVGQPPMRHVLGPCVAHTFAKSLRVDVSASELA